MSEKNKNSYAIVKILKNGEKITSVLLLDANSEIWEFNNIDKAQKMADRLTKNSDSGWLYFVRKI